MKYTDIIQGSINYLKEVGTVSKINEYRGTPHEFTGPNEKIVIERGYINSPSYSRRINRQTLSRLVMLGYAEYTDKNKETAIFIDKDIIDRELKRKAKKYEELYRVVDKMFYDIGNQWTDEQCGNDIEEFIGDLRKFMYGESEGK